MNKIGILFKLKVASTSRPQKSNSIQGRSSAYFVRGDFCFAFAIALRNCK
jgi:hypothetical protein